MPPKSTPAAAPPPATAPQTPSALFRSAPSSNVVVMIESVAGATSAAPTPCTLRDATSIAVELESPHASEAAVKIATPSIKIKRRPSRSAQRPPRSRKPPKVIVYAVITHCSPLAEKCSEREIDGSATVTIETSSTVMKNATQTTASASQRRGSGVVRAASRSCTDTRTCLRFPAVIAGLFSESISSRRRLPPGDVSARRIIHAIEAARGEGSGTVASWLLLQPGGTPPPLAHQPLCLLDIAAGVIWRPQGRHWHCGARRAPVASAAALARAPSRPTLGRDRSVGAVCCGGE